MSHLLIRHLKNWILTPNYHSRRTTLLFEIHEQISKHRWFISSLTPGHRKLRYHVARQIRTVTTPTFGLTVKATICSGSTLLTSSNRVPRPMFSKISTVILRSATFATVYS